MRAAGRGRAAAEVAVLRYGYRQAGFDLEGQAWGWWTGGKERRRDAAEQQNMDTELILWLLALLFPQPRPLREGRRRKRKRVLAPTTPSKGFPRPVGAGISWCFPLARRGPGAGSDSGERPH
jgi:hypothetical protein